LTIATINHIDVDERGVARIAGSRIKVIHLVMEKRANGWGPEELQEQFPHLTLAQIHSAFAYFYDHQEQLDQQIDESVRHAEDRVAGGDYGRKNPGGLSRTPTRCPPRDGGSVSPTGKGNPIR
jgi:uncharacterized protein (DUF433 family)